MFKISPFGRNDKNGRYSKLSCYEQDAAYNVSRRNQRLGRENQQNVGGHGFEQRFPVVIPERPLDDPDRNGNGQQGQKREGWHGTAKNRSDDPAIDQHGEKRKEISRISAI